MEFGDYKRRVVWIAVGYMQQKMRNTWIAIGILSIGGCVNGRPKIECTDLNNFSSDTSIYVEAKGYKGFIFPASYKPPFQVSQNRFTPDQAHIRRAEGILASSDKKYRVSYRRQYIGSVNTQLDSIIIVRLMKYGFKEECFDKFMEIRFDGKYGKN
ncbi:hypothetical protein [Catalinimonas alkaloidigena]|uniref:hypothetical protein n=1 Tax=Catalinimonas alkaloidigena TaxID=1075417 RepID=UPI000B7EE78E|nr:hypothetical protein [Catalinimonas alkaloidigena]